MAQNGLSHFVEHMLFRGTEWHQSSHGLATVFEELGGTLEALTAADHGALSISVPKENLQAVLPLLADVFSRPIFRDVEVERRIIVEELLEDCDENGQLIDPSSLTRALTFGQHPLGRPIIGPLDNVQSFTKAQLMAHHKRTYQGQGTVVSVAGSVEKDQVARWIEEHFGSIPGGTWTPQAEAPLGQQAPRAKHVVHPGSSQTSLGVSFRAPGYTDPKGPAYEMLLRVLDDGMATRLYHEICDARGLCYSVSAGYETYEETGIFELYADTAHERTAEVLEQMLRVTSELCAHDVTDAELDRARNRTRWEYEALLDSADDLADLLALHQLQGMDDPPPARLEKLLAVSHSDLRAAAQQLFAPAVRNVVTVGSLTASARRRVEALALR
jgi:predicted Zn-dependent peptidase